MGIFIEAMMLDIILTRHMKGILPKAAREGWNGGVPDNLLDRAYTEQDIARLKRRFKALAPTRWRALYGEDAGEV